MIGIIAQKVQMTSAYIDGKFLPIVILKFEPVKVLRFSRDENNVKMIFGFYPIDPKHYYRYNKAYLNSMNQNTKSAFKIIREFNLPKSKFESIKNEIDMIENCYKQDAVLDINALFKDRKLKISGQIKGRGFAGNIKRHGFSIKGRSNVSATHRASGSIGSRKPARVIKGRKMPGRYDGIVSVRNQKLFKHDSDNNVLFIIGSAPGSNGGIVTIYPNFFPKK